MNIEVEHLEKTNKGGIIFLRVDLDKNELLKLDRNSLMKFEDFQVDLIGDRLYFQSYVETSEPWEDLSLEEFAKALKLEVEYKVNQVLSLY
jgi:hypothetical protein